MIIGRRGFIAGIGALIAAPAIVRASSLMPVRAPKHIYELRTLLPSGTWRMYNKGVPYGVSPATAALRDMVTLQDWARLQLCAPSPLDLYPELA